MLYLQFYSSPDDVSLVGETLLNKLCSFFCFCRLLTKFSTLFMSPCSQNASYLFYLAIIFLSNQFHSVTNSNLLSKFQYNRTFTSSVAVLTRNVTDGGTDILKLVQTSITNTMVWNFLSTSNIYNFRKMSSKCNIFFYKKHNNSL